MNTDVASPPAVHRPGAGTVVLTINGQVRELRIEAGVSLLDALREHLALTGSKKGCDQGTCAAERAGRHGGIRGQAGLRTPSATTTGL
jgi:xanthine dehydrogenase YagT iron-sulfur-binding subunit